MQHNGIRGVCVCVCLKETVKEIRGENFFEFLVLNFLDSTHHTLFVCLVCVDGDLFRYFISLWKNCLIEMNRTSAFHENI